MAEMNVGLNLVLLGKTAAGKSSSGNTILGREAFISKKSSRSVTLDVAVESGTVDGIPVNVYDTPGLFDTERSDDEIQQKYEELLQRCGSVCCVFLLVIKADRFTEEERETVEKIEELLGEDRLEKTWILFTRGDELEEGNITIQEFINDNQHLKNIVKNYDQRYHVFNNKTRGHTGQVKMLIKKILEARLHTMGKGATKLDQSSLKRQKPKATLAVSLSSRRIVLLGKTGVGKSAAGNTILGQKAFTSVMSRSPVTSESSGKHATVSDRSVSVVDTPGLFDTQMKTEELVTEIARSVYISSPGPQRLEEERRQRFEEEIQRLEEEIQRLEERRQRLEEEIQRLEEEIQRLEEERQRLEEERQRLEEERQRLEEERQRLEEERQRLEERRIRQEQKSFWVNVGTITGAVIAAPIVAVAVGAAVVALPVAAGAAAFGAAAVGAAAAGAAGGVAVAAVGEAVGEAVAELNANRREKERRKQDKKK